MAQTALADLGYRIDERDRASGVLSALPADRRSSEPAGPRGTRLSRQRPRRSLARVRVVQAGETVNVYCKVLVQEQVTEVHRMFARDHSGQDTPGETPIQRDAATTTRQNTVWRTVRRDKLAERDIVARILDLCDVGETSP